MTNHDDDKKPATRLKLRGGTVSANFVHSQDAAMLNAMDLPPNEEHHPLPKKLPSGHHEPLTIDITPTWKAVLPIILAGIENGTFEGRRIAVEELQRMADLADRATAAIKAGKEI